MPLSPGSKLGPYEIQSSLGAGGMGEVYSARDPRLDRTVAIKILPEHLSEKPEAHARFEREARAISSLSHLNTKGSSIRSKQSSGIGQEEIVLDGATAPGGPFSLLWPQWTPDGKYLANQKQNGPTNVAFWAQPTTGPNYSDAPLSRRALARLHFHRFGARRGLRHHVPHRIGPMADLAK